MRQFDNYTKKRLNRYYEIKRQTAERQRDLRVASLMEKFPELHKLEAKYAAAGVNEVKKKINPSFDSKGLDLNLVEQQLNEFLLSHNIPFDYSEPDYECKLCHDKGWLDNGYCSCVNRALIELNQHDGLYMPPAEATFENYNLHVYSNEKNLKFYSGKMSSREYMRSVKAFSEEYVRSFSEHTDSLFLFGHPGTGKTYLMSCIANELHNQGTSIVYINATRLFSILTKQRILMNTFNPDPVKIDAAERMLDLLYKSELLCIDDIGIHDRSMINVYPDLILLLDERLNAGLSTIMTSNLSPAKLAEDHDKRIESRITGNYELILFEGLDVRKTEAGKRQGIVPKKT